MTVIKYQKVSRCLFSGDIMIEVNFNSAITNEKQRKEWCVIECRDCGLQKNCAYGKSKIKQVFIFR
jgi:hypothetical protein